MYYELISDLREKAGVLLATDSSNLNYDCAVTMNLAAFAIESLCSSNDFYESLLDKIFES